MNPKFYYPIITIASLIVAAVFLSTAGPSVASPVGHGVSADQSPHSPKKWAWEGNARVICENNECKVISSVGVVYAASAFEAKVMAEHELRREAGRVGNVLSVSINISSR